MSSSTKPGLLPPFSPAATQAAVKASTDSYPADYISSIIIEISGYLVSFAEKSALFGRLANDPWSPSLRTLRSRLHSGQLNPSPIQSHANESARIRATLGQRTAKDAAHRPLEDFEDLYYAVLARMQDIHQILTARLGSGFSTFTDAVYPDGPSIADLYVSLAQYWDVLNHTAFVKPIDCAIRRSRVKYLHQEIIAQVHNDEITQIDAEELLSDLYDPNEYDGIQGLAWVSGWAPSMVAAWLEEKYRVVLKIEKEDAESKGRMDRKRSKMGKKVKQPQNKLKSRKEGKKAVDEMQMAGGEAKMAMPVDQQMQEQSMRGHQSQQDQLQYALEWQMKTQRVSEYSQYLRSMASRNAKYLVESTASNNDMRTSGLGGPVQHADNRDTNMMGGDI
ncbi:hypothetical protein BU25DRAFT_382262 [Macroventuria anomochaeta]|uniref:Uncharacterized protein n=1 Tax=Macroventuria anomochaeta TaxID=301207 RepID=A0ACB6SEQ5_9PLEO|nr:uncharacterized protein BU25DRAFT_382262 [Macroventuria anomochaeta]KAF2632636.1 hypothetical protein BU25DRAFT_382262 [Macroventuria anomochaeta]